MSNRLRQLVIWALVAVVAVGNGVSMSGLSAADFAHGLAHVTSSAPSHAHAAGAAHDHGEYATHASRVQTPGSHHGVDIADAATCDHSSCTPDDAQPCCHTHAHCCMTLATLPPAYGAGLEHRAHTLPFDAGASLPLGAIFYPLLRPPRAAA